jgi:hypothetical protein
MIAADIAARVGARQTPTPAGLRLQGMLMTGAAPRPLATNAPATAARGSLWQPADKVYGKYLTPYLHATNPPRSPPTRRPAESRSRRPFPVPSMPCKRTREL